MLNCSTYFSASKIDSIIKKRDKTSTFDEKSLSMQQQQKLS